MKCLEIIEICSVNPNRRELEQQIRALFRQIAATEQTVKLFKNGLADADFSIHVQYETESTTGQMSATGEQIAAALREWGLVNHSVWIQLG